MNADCSTVRLQSSRLIEETDEALLAHVAACADCRAALETERRVRDRVRAAAPSLEPSWQPVESGRRAVTAGRRPLLLLAPAAVLVLFAAVLFAVIRTGSSPAEPGPQPSVSSPPSQDIDRLIEHLGHDGAEKRQEAQRLLEALGEKVEPRLRAFLESPDVNKDSETAGRVRDILAKLERTRIGRIAYVRLGANSTVAAGGGQLVLCDWDGGNAVELAPEGRASYAMPVWSPDGRWIGFTERGARGAAPDGSSTVCVADAEGRNYRRIGPGLLAGWLDSDRMIVERGKKAFLAVSRIDGKEEPLAEQRPPGRPAAPMMDLLRSKGWTEQEPLVQAGNRVAFIVRAVGDAGAVAYTLHLLDERTGECREVKPGPVGSHFSFSPDGSWLLFEKKGKTPPEIVRVAADTMKESPVHALDYPYSGTMFPSTSRDASKVAFLATRGAGYELWIAGVGNGGAKPLARVGGFMGRPFAWQPGPPAR